MKLLYSGHKKLLSRAAAAVVAIGLGIPLAPTASAQVFPMVTFRSCAEAFAAGYHDMRVGEPGYSKNLDRDGDGIACETADGPAPAPSPSPTPAPTPVPAPVQLPEGRIYGVDGAGNLQLFTGTLSGMSYRGKRGSGWGGMSYLAQINNVVGDSNRDLLARRSSDNSLWLYSTKSDGTVSTVGQVGQNWGGMDQIVPVFNLGGGTTQYVVARRKADGALFRYVITAKGLGAGIQIGTNWNGMRQIVGVGDFNKDGRADVMGLRTDGTLWFYAGTGSATIGAGKQVGNGWGGFNLAFSPGDLNRDGRFDLVGRRSDGVVFGYENKSGSWGVGKQLLTGTSGYRLLA